MIRPPTYARAGRAIIKRPRGTLYLVEDIDPILDQIEANQGRDQERSEEYEKHKRENHDLKLQNESMVKTIEDMEKEVDRMATLLEKAEEKVDILYRIKKMIP